MTNSVDSSSASTPPGSALSEDIADLREMDRFFLDITRAGLRWLAEQQAIRRGNGPRNRTLEILAGSLHGLETRSRLVEFDLSHVGKRLDRIREEGVTQPLAERDEYRLTVLAGQYQDALGALLRLDAWLGEVEIDIARITDEGIDPLRARAAQLRQQVVTYQAQADALDARFEGFGVTPARP